MPVYLSEHHIRLLVAALRNGDSLAKAKPTKVLPELVRSHGPDRVADAAAVVDTLLKLDLVISGGGGALFLTGKGRAIALQHVSKLEELLRE